MTTRKGRSLVSFAIALALLVAIPMGAAAGEKPKITAWLYKTYLPDLNEYMKQTLVDYGKKNNVDVDVSFVGMLDMVSKLTPTIESGNPPDIMTIYSTDALRFKDSMLDVSDIYDQIGKSMGGWIPVARTIFGKEKIFGVPYGIEEEVLHARADRLKEAGAKIPETWEDLRQAAIKTHRPDRVGFCQPLGGRTSDGEKAFMMLLWSYGGGIVDETGRNIVFESPETYRATQFYADLYLKDKVIPPGATSWTGSDNNIMYQTGRCNMTINTGSIYAYIQKNSPELHKVTALVPSPRGPAGAFTFVMVDVYAIAKTTKHPEIAKDMLRYVFRKEHMTKLMELSRTQHAPPLVELQNEPMWRGEAEQVFIQNLKVGAATVGYPGPITAPAAEAFSTLVLSDMFGRIAVDSWPIERAIKDTTRRLKEIWAKYKF